MTSRRLEDPDLITGRGRYVADVRPDDLAYAAFVRSPVAHGVLNGVELDAVRAAPGVIAAFAAADLDLRDMPDRQPIGPPAPGMTRPPLARNTVRYAGEPVAILVAESTVYAEDAAALAWPDIDPLEPVVSDDEALHSGTVLFPDAGSNVVENVRIATDGFDPETTYAVMVDVEVASPRLAPVPIEPLAITVEPGEVLTVWCSHQAPHRLKRQLAKQLELDEGSVRVIVPDVGGAFGMKGALYPEYVVTAAAALAIGRPVSWTERRREQFSGGTHGRGQHHRVRLAGDADGRIRRARFSMVSNVGAYPHNGSMIPGLSRWVSTGLHDIEHVEIEGTVVVSNIAPTGPYRGAGRPEAALAIARAVDEYAHAAGIAVEEVYRRNLIRPDQFPYRAASGAVYDSGDYQATLDRALEIIDVTEVRREQTERLAAGLNPIGFGIGAFIERAGGSIESGEYGKVEIAEDGRVVVRTGSVAMGQGTRTVWAETVADVFGVDRTDVRVFAGDTGEVADGVGSFASRSAQLGASAAVRMARVVIDRARELAAELLEANPADLVVADGMVSVAGVPDSGMTLAALSAEAVRRGNPLESEEMFAPGAQTFPYGAHLAVVEVDLDTGEVRPIRLAAVDDCGTVLNPMIVEGQLHGSVMQGIGQALLERVQYDEFGNLLTSTLMDYLVPNAATAMPLVTDRTYHPAPSNPLGAKGTGEAGCIGMPAAILNAALDALRPYGVEELQLPLLPARVWAALDAARS